MIEAVSRITTIDGTIHECSVSRPSEVQLWAVNLSIGFVDRQTGHVNPHCSTKATVHVERDVLVNAGLLPWCIGDKKPTIETEETAEQLIIRLLNHVGVYPE
jgi:hypothetical protein